MKRPEEHDVRACVSRRCFLRATVAASASAAFPALSYFRAEGAENVAIQLGYAAITWGSQHEQAIDEIAALGFRGIQLRSNLIPHYGSRPPELRQRLVENNLALLCFSSGSIDAESDREREYLETHVNHATFVKALGGNLLQITSRRPKERAPTAQEYERLGRLLTEIGRRTIDVGVRVVYHNHMNGFGEAPEEVARVLEVTDPQAVGFLLDIAHYKQGGGDPIAAVTRHRDRLVILHLKDVVSPIPGDTRPPRMSYRWVELGRGKVDVPGVIQALKQIDFRGPAVIELDSVPDPSRTPKQCAALNRQYALETLRLSL